MSLPGLVLFCSFFGFGAFARAMGFSMGEAVFTSGVVWALPGQVVLFSGLADGAHLAAAFVAVTLTAVRLLPLTVAILPLMRRDRQSWISQYFLAHFVAVTVWVESMRRFNDMEHAERIPFFLGLSLTVVPLNLLATALGHAASATVPPAASAALLFLTPIYFILSMTSAARARADHLAMGLGLALGPVFYRLAPGLDLLWTGLVGGTLAWLAGRAMERRR
ncbi:AzlC family ABC transporter permease [Lutibaculum baratangense]|uniref:AzlC family protein n=1 Tax=Lutibaculum baratangense AMV1 TaxID=631454 RepID=V4RJZ8_9HYPH|nr:AzlC family ABC transporter permease [Lutibaculum baratangense]ESR23580.1 AzlC family protein [Lutibaculum baratangense AMV1]